MNKQKIIDNFKSFKHLSDTARQQFFVAFERKMLYRTTKTENPKTTLKTVQKVLDQIATTA